MKTIWKYTLSIAGRQSFTVPSRAQILTVQMQGAYAQLWALVDRDDYLTAPREIAIYGTGNPVPDNPGRYIGTVQIHDGSLVWHAFEVDQAVQVQERAK